jgi:dolichol-phosphate mannosyltransferase
MSTRIFREAFLGVIQMKVNSWFRKYQKPKEQAKRVAAAESL